MTKVREKRAYDSNHNSSAVTMSLRRHEKKRLFLLVLGVVLIVRFAGLGRPVPPADGSIGLSSSGRSSPKERDGTDGSIPNSFPIHNDATPAVTVERRDSTVSGGLTSGTVISPMENVYDNAVQEDGSTVQRIYYINLDKNVRRRENSEAWLSQQPIPFERVSALVGSDNPEDCVEEKREPAGRCRGISGLSKTELDIIRNRNTTGLTLVFEDDYIAQRPLDEAVDEALSLVPSDWDVIRFDCWGERPETFDYVVPDKVFRTVHQRECTSGHCIFYGGTHAMLWRGSRVGKLDAVWSQEPFDSIDFRLTTDKINSYCVKSTLGKIASPEGEGTDIPKAVKPVGTGEEVASDLPKSTVGALQGDGSIVERIYYINLDKNVRRRENSEAWLSQQPIPFERVSALVGSDNPEDCVEEKREPAGRCRGISGLSKTELDIIRTRNTTGLTLVFEDDYIAQRPLDEAVDEALRLVPSDWDVIRFDCWGERPETFDYVVPDKVFRTVHQRECPSGNCIFYGGTHAMLWRGSRTAKLDAVWSQEPFDSIDFRLTTDKLNSYCVESALGRIASPEGEGTDIPKALKPSANEQQISPSPNTVHDDGSTVQRIYYINTDNSIQRRDNSEAWLRRQRIPFQRVPSLVGSNNAEDCVEEKREPAGRCRRITSRAKTELDIIRNHNTTGLTMVFEDDFVAKRPIDEAVEEALRFVPSDWDVIRFDCWGDRPETFDYVVTDKIFQTAHQRACTDGVCAFYGGTHAMLWRGSRLAKLDALWSQEPFDSIDFRLTTNKLKSYCVNSGLGKIVSPQDEGTETVQDDGSTVQRIYYINLDKNVRRRENSETWLSQQPIPFERVSALVGSDNPEDCVEEKREPAGRCRGISGLSKTELDIIRNRNTTGLTLVFEDDYIAERPLDEAVEEALSLVPSDWDVIRFDCWGERPETFDYVVPDKVFRTVHQRECTSGNCIFYGGTHAMLWRGSRAGKLDAVWSQEPFDSIDFRLTTDKLNSYCVQSALGKIASPEGEGTDIPKAE